MLRCYEGVNEKLENKELLMGFGYCVYRLGGDPRNALIKVWSKYLWGDDLLFKISEVIEALMKEKRPSSEYIGVEPRKFVKIQDR